MHVCMHMQLNRQHIIIIESQLDQLSIVSGTIGALSLLLVIGIVVVVIYLCYYVRKSDVHMKESDL